MRVMLSRTGDRYVRLPSHLYMISIMTGPSFPSLFSSELCYVIITARDCAGGPKRKIYEERKAGRARKWRRCVKMSDCRCVINCSDDGKYV